jgi:RNA polymerase sigma-70 factor (ECF subfamily)
MSQLTDDTDTGFPALEMHEPELEIAVEPDPEPQPEGFEAFYRTSYLPIARALSYTLSDVDLAREATDEAMVRAYAHWEKIGHYDSPAGWVYRVGLNWARSAHRRLSRVLPFHDRRDLQEPPVTDPALHDALRALDVKLRAVVVCRLLLDWSVDETAVALDIKPGTVKSRLHRALHSLERSLSHLR